MRILISAPHFKWRDVNDCLRRAADELGLDGVELSWDTTFQHPSCTQQDLEFLSALRGKTKLALVSHIWEDLARLGPGPGDRMLLRWLDVCERTGVRSLVVHGGSYPDRNQGIQRTRQVLEGALARYEAAGVVLNVENHYAYDFHNCSGLFSEPWEFLKIFSLNSPSLRFCFDTGHAHLVGNSQALLSELAPWLNHVHLADNGGLEDDHLMFRQGTVAWDSVLDALLHIGYDGSFCVEFPARDNLEPLRMCVGELRTRWRTPDTGKRQTRG